jgi:hypothetical protein
MTKCGVVSFVTLQITRTWSAAYNLKVVEWLKERGLDETPDNVRRAMRGIEEHDREIERKARILTDRAAALRRRKIDRRHEERRRG